MRVTNTMMYNQMMTSVSNNMETYNRLTEQMSTERRINNPSDDPVGFGVALNQHTDLSATNQYVKNMKEAEEFLKATDSALNSIDDIITNVREIAETNATETATATNRSIAADQIDQYIDQSIEIANTQVRDRYIFSGFKTGDPAYSTQGRVLDPYANTNNFYQGKVAASGDYQLTQNQTYMIKFTQGGNVGTAGAATTAKYSISTDNGATWSDEQDFTSLSVDVIDKDGIDSGLNLEFDPAELHEDDVFKLDITAGNYQGDNGKIDYNANKNTRLTTNVTGQEVFEDNKYFQTLHKLSQALKNNNQLEIAQSVADLKTLQTDMQTQISSAGVSLSRVQVAQSNLTSMQENLTASIQDIEKVDAVQTLTQFTMAENALNASVTALAKIFPKSLLNYL